MTFEEYQNAAVSFRTDTANNKEGSGTVRAF